MRTASTKAGFLLVPVRLRVFVQGRKHDGQNHGGVFCEETHDVLVIPVVERAFGDLRERRGVGVYV